MGRRQDLHVILEKLFDGIVNPSTGRYVETCVKYQPGSTTKLTYPAILYKLDDMPAIFANNKPYHWDHRYELQVIDRDPESPLRERVVQLPMCKFERQFVSDNLYHFVFYIYY